jgi:lysophospholipase L1-like esterase
LADPPSLMAVTPTFTLGTVGLAPTLTGPVYAHDDTTVYRVLGGRTATINSLGTDYQQNVVNTHNTGSGAFTPTRWFKEFMHYGQSFETGIRGGATTAEFRVWADGKPSHSTPQSIATASNNSRYYLKVDFGSVALRHVMIEVSVATLGSLVIGPADAVWKPDVRYKGPRVIVVGDSFTAGANGVSSSNTWPNKLAELMGWRDVWIAGEGGTGYVNRGNTGIGADNYVFRVPYDVLPWSPDIVLLSGGLNDENNAATAAVNAVTIMASIRASLPAAKLIVFGAVYTTGTPTANMVGTRDAIRAAAATYAHLSIEAMNGPYPYSGSTSDYTSKAWLTGSGKSGSPSANGNADVFRGTDGTHPTQAGHDYYGHRVAQAISAGLPL